ncbi:MAG TPA: (d)CMP kinase [Pyrinomonadaceae bacterium]|nr:(d)CMP kinase [Pyrinomonadaceae bacterium]
MIIAIDGPSGAGKSTLGKMLAKELGLLYLDTGAMYRAVAFAVLEKGLDIKDQEAVIKLASESEIELSGEPDSLHIFLNGRDVSGQIRTNEVGQTASIVSSISEVRRLLVKRQQELGQRGAGCVLDGRDIGTVVFPNADVKFFLDAKPEARANRRYEEDLQRGLETTYEKTLEEINVRDKRDKTRADSPLSVADDAILVDTSELNTDEVFAKMIEIVKGKKSSIAI